MRKFGSVSGLSRALNKPAPQALYAYLRGNSRPGPTLQQELRDAGCDIEWLMTGIEETQTGPPESEKVGFARRFEDCGHSRFGYDFDWRERYADALGITVKALNLYLTGAQTPTPDLQKRLRNIGCDTDWLLHGSGADQRHDNEPLYGGELGVIPVYGFFSSDPQTGDEFRPLENVFYPFFRGRYFALIIQRDSMIHAKLPGTREGLYPNDLVIFEERRVPKSGDVVTVQLRGGKRLVKVLERLRDRVAVLHAANSFRSDPWLEIKQEEIVSWGVYVNHFPLDEAFKKRIGIPIEEKPK